jgi:hypothetical protein
LSRATPDPVALINFAGAHDRVDSRPSRPKGGKLISAGDVDQRSVDTPIGRQVRRSSP